MGDEELVEKMRRYQQTIQELKSLESFHQENYQQALDYGWASYGVGFSKIVHGFADGAMSVFKELDLGRSGRLVGALYDGANVAVNETYNHPSTAGQIHDGTTLVDVADKLSTPDLKGTGFGSLLKAGSSATKLVEKGVDGELGDHLTSDAKDALSGAGSFLKFAGDKTAGAIASVTGGVVKGAGEMYDGAQTIAGVDEEQQRLVNNVSKFQSDLQSKLLDMESRRADLIREAQSKGIEIPEDILPPGATLGMHPDQVGQPEMNPAMTSELNATESFGEGSGYSGHSAAESAAEAAEHAQHALQSEQEASRSAEQAGQHEQEAAQHAQLAGQIEQEAAQHAQTSAQHAQEAGQHDQAAAQHAEESIQHAQSAGAHAQEAHQHAQAAAQHEQEAAQHAQMSSQHAREASQHAQAAGQQEQEAGRHAEAAGQHAQEAGQHAQTAGHHEREAAAALGTTRDQEANAQRARDETTNLHEEAARLKDEIAHLHETAAALERTVDELRARAEELASQVETAARECDEYRTQATSYAQEAASGAGEAAAAAARAQTYAGD
jgi:hypothetical protein